MKQRAMPSMAGDVFRRKESHRTGSRGEPDGIIMSGVKAMKSGFMLVDLLPDKVAFLFLVVTPFPPI